MEEDRTSESVVIPDISEPLTNETEEHGTLTSEHHQSVTPVAVSVSSTPVSLPVSLIGVAGGGATFNVITPDQLQVRYQNGELKATHIVIQDVAGTAEPPGTPATPTTPTTPLGIRECPNTWHESVHLPVLPVRCKNTSAELHKAKFGSGGRGRCIKLQECWYTPSEFEALCGRASSKDWKRSIRFGGRSLQTLIDEGILTPHATSCTCSACCDDESASGPIRLFTPYKRRKRKDTNDGDPARKLKRVVSKEICSNGDDSDADSMKTEDETWRGSTTTTYVQRTLSDGMIVTTSSAVPATSVSTVVSPTQPVTTNEQGLQVNEYQQPIVTGTVTDAFKKMEDMSGRMLRLALQFRQMIEELKERSKREMEEMKEQMKREKEQAVLAARVETHVACTRAVFEPRTEGLPVQVVDPLDTVGLQPTSDATENRKCSNCNREAFAECSLCRRTPYCSTFCQRKDWASHQVECVRSATDPTMSQTSSIMLIVESSDQVLSQAPTGHGGTE